MGKIINLKNPFFMKIPGEIWSGALKDGLKKI